MLSLWLDESFVIDTMRPSYALISAALFVELEVICRIWRLLCCDIRNWRTFLSPDTWKFIPLQNQITASLDLFALPALLCRLGCISPRAKIWTFDNYESVFKRGYSWANLYLRFIGLQLILLTRQLSVAYQSALLSTFSMNHPTSLVKVTMTEKWIWCR